MECLWFLGLILGLTSAMRLPGACRFCFRDICDDVKAHQSFPRCVYYARDVDLPIRVPGVLQLPYSGYKDLRPYHYNPN